jgi:hypothetical protein
MSYHLFPQEVRFTHLARQRRRVRRSRGGRPHDDCSGDRVTDVAESTRAAGDPERGAARACDMAWLHFDFGRVVGERTQETVRSRRNVVRLTTLAPPEGFEPSPQTEVAVPRPVARVSGPESPARSPCAELHGDDQEGARLPSGIQEPERRPADDLRLHRTLLQPAAVGTRGSATSVQWTASWPPRRRPHEGPALPAESCLRNWQLQPLSLLPLGSRLAGLAVVTLRQVLAQGGSRP